MKVNVVGIDNGHIVLSDNSRINASKLADQLRQLGEALEPHSYQDGVDLQWGAGGLDAVAKLTGVRIDTTGKAIFIQ